MFVVLFIKEQYINKSKIPITVTMTMTTVHLNKIAPILSDMWKFFLYETIITKPTTIARITSTRILETTSTPNLDKCLTFGSNLYNMPNAAKPIKPLSMVHI